MNMFEEAAAINAMLTARGLTQKTLAGILGVSQPYIANKLRLLRFSEKARALILESGLTERHARTLLKLDEDRIPVAIERIRIGRMNVREAEICVELLCEEQHCVRLKSDEPGAGIRHFEDILELCIRNLRSLGIDASLSSERYKDKLYFSICVG